MINSNNILRESKINCDCSILYTFISPGYRHSSRKSLKISTDEYHPENGEPGNCIPPTSDINHDTPGTENHCSPNPLIAGRL